MSIKSYKEMSAEQRFAYRMGEQWLKPTVETAYDELFSLNEDWFTLDERARRVRMQNALGLLAGPMIEIEERDSAEATS